MMIKKPPIAFAGHKGAWIGYIMQMAAKLPAGFYFTAPPIWPAH